MSVHTEYAPVTAPIASVTLSCNDTPTDKLKINRAYDGHTAFRLNMNASRTLFASKQDLLDLAEQLTTLANQAKP